MRQRRAGVSARPRLVVPIVALLAAGCPADDPPDEDTVAFCAQSQELDEQLADPDEPPTDAQFESLAAAAPAEIRADVEVVADGYADGGVDALAEPDVAEARERLEDWEADNCP